MVSYFQTHGRPVLTCLFLQFGATICLGLFCATTVGRLRFLGARPMPSEVQVFPFPWDYSWQESRFLLRS